MSTYLKMGFCAVVLGMLGGCATMTPEQTAAFVQAMQATANAVDPYEYAGPRQPVEPQPEVVQQAPQAEVYNGRAYAPQFQQQASAPQPPPQSAPIGSNITPQVRCTPEALTGTLICQ